MQFCLKNCKEDFLYGFSVTIIVAGLLQSADTEILISGNAAVLCLTRQSAP